MIILPNLTTEIVWSFGIELVILLVLLYLIYVNTHKFININHSRPLLVFLLSLVGLFLISITSIFCLFIPQDNIELFINMKKFYFICYFIFLYALLLLFELFENETLLTHQQVVFTVITTVLAIYTIFGNVQAVWLDLDQIYLVQQDSVIALIFLMFSIVVGAFILSDLRNGLKDVWITQRRQLLLMITSTVIIVLIPLIISGILALNRAPYSILVELIVRMPAIIGVILLSLSFGGPLDFSLFYRRKADKLIITNISGIPMFHYDFKENVHYVNETLFSGAIVAITMLMSESIKSSSPIAEVLMKNKYRLQ